MSFRRERVFTNDHLVSLEIRQGEEIDQPRQLRKRKPREGIDMTQPLKVGIASRFVSPLQDASRLRLANLRDASVPDLSRQGKEIVPKSTL